MRRVAGYVAGVVINLTASAIYVYISYDYPQYRTQALAVWMSLALSMLCAWCAARYWRHR